MKNVNILIHKYIREIIFIVLLDVASFYIFSMAYSNDMFKITRAYNNKSYAIIYHEEDTTNYNLNNKKIINIELVNNTVASQGYSIVLRISRYNLNNYNNIYIYYNNKEYLLSSLYRNEDNDYYYFSLGKGNIEEQYMYIPFGIYTKDNIDRNISFDIINEIGIDISNELIKL